MLNVAHRGLWKESHLPQNTVEAIKAAYDAGATMVETDFVETKSGEIICLHDRKALASMSTFVKDPTEISAADRAAIDLGEKMGLPRPYRIPLLTDVLAVVPKDRMIQAEIKVYGPTYARQFDAAVRAAGLCETNVLVSSFNHGALKDFHGKCPKYRTLWLGCGITGKGFDLDDVIVRAKDGGFDIICPGCADAKKAGFVRADADRIRAAGFDFRVYGVNDESLLEYAAELEATGFTCNYFKTAYGWARHLGNVKLVPDVDVDLTGVFPKNIKCVHLVAPSSLPPKEAIVKVTNALARAGYKVKVSPGVWAYAPDGAQRARYLETAWKDPETDLILCGRGGRGGYDTVTNLDFSVLRSRDVPFVGFSNISCLMNAFVAKGVGRPISGPMCTSMVRYPTTRDSIERLSATVAGELLEETRLKVLRPAVRPVSGKPIGGHWPSISRMDNEWLPSTDGRIVFLEVNKTYSLEKAKATFHSLKGKGYFARPAAVVLCDLGISGTKKERKELVRFLVGELSCPVFQGYPYGHVSRCYAIDYGRTAEISPDGVLSWKEGLK